MRHHVSMLTGGEDPHYALGLVMALVRRQVPVEVIGSDELDCAELRREPLVRFLNLRGDRGRSATFLQRARRLSLYYARLLKYAIKAEPGLFHILWNNKIQLLDRTLLTWFYRLCGRRVLLTAHNVNAARRDGRDSWLNRTTLRIQYGLCDRVFVHTPRMKEELRNEFGVPEHKIALIPYGINDAVPMTALTPVEARARLGLSANERVLLFFGNIAPYKGLDVLVEAFGRLVQVDARYRLVIAGQPKVAGTEYWQKIRADIQPQVDAGQILLQIRHIPDEEIELYFKGADVLVLPYTDIFQSGIMFLGYSFGLPVVATDVGSLKDDVLTGETGFVCAPRDPAALATALQTYFSSALFAELGNRRDQIARVVGERHSWEEVANITNEVYRSVVAEASR